MKAAPDAFIARWEGREGGQERANYALFLSELCDVIGVPRPDPSARATDNDYVIERAVKRQNPDGSSGAGRITATLFSGPRHATDAHRMRIVAVSMGYDRAAPERAVNTTLNEDLVRRARVLTPNLSEIVESLLAAYVDDAEAQMVRREQKIAAHFLPATPLQRDTARWQTNSAPCDGGSAQRSPQPQPEPARRSIRRRPGQPRRPVVPLVQPRRSVRQTAISGQIS